MSTSPADSPARRHNRATLIIILATVALLLTLPAVVRWRIGPTPTLNDKAREFLPPAVSKSDLVILRSDSAEWTAAVAPMLPRFADAASLVFPPFGERPDPTADVVSQITAIEGAVMVDADKFGKAWLMVYGVDNRLPGQRATGRAGFFLYCVADTTDPERTTPPSPRGVGDIAALLARGVLEQQLGEQFRYLPEWYRRLVGEMVAVIVVPEIVDDAWNTYRRARRDRGHDPFTEHSFVRAFESSAEPDPAALAAGTIMASWFVRTPRARDLVFVVRDGNEVETAFRAAAAGVVVASEAASAAAAAHPGLAESAPPQTVQGTSLEKMLARVEAEYLARFPPGR